MFLEICLTRGLVRLDVSVSLGLKSIETHRNPRGTHLLCPCYFVSLAARFGEVQTRGRGDGGGARATAGVTAVPLNKQH